jgi:peptidoglycan hydrolase-like protein with peptidoglycan-binding domain
MSILGALGLSSPTPTPNPYSAMPLQPAGPTLPMSATSPYGAVAGQPVTVVPTSSASKNVTQATQRALSSLGLYSGPENGRPNKRLRAALKKFQREHGLAVTGTATRKTRSALAAQVRKLAAESGTTNPGTVPPSMTVPQPNIPTIPAAGLGTGGYGSPYGGVGLGANVPQVNTTNQSALAPGSRAGQQSVTNANSNTSSSRSSDPYGLGMSPFGASPLGSILGAAGIGTPYGAYGASPYGSPYSAMSLPGPSITGQWYLNGGVPARQGGISGFFRSLFG